MCNRLQSNQTALCSLQFGSFCRLSVSQFPTTTNCSRSLNDGFFMSSSGYRSLIHSSIHPFLHLSIRFLVVSRVMLAVGVLRCRPGGAGVLLSPRASVAVCCLTSCSAVFTVVSSVVSAKSLNIRDARVAKSKTKTRFIDNFFCHIYSKKSELNQF